MYHNVPETKWAYLVLGLLAAIDIIISLRVIPRLVQGNLQLPAEAPLIFILLLALQIIVVWLFWYIRNLLQYYRGLKASYEHELDFTRQLLDTSELGMAVVDHEWRLLYINKKFAELFNMTPTEGIGQRITEICLPGHRDLIEQQQQLFWEGKSSPFPMLLEEPEEPRRSLQVQAAPRRHQGRIVGALISARDLEERVA